MRFFFPVILFLSCGSSLVSQGQEIKVLKEGQLHQDEVWENAAGEQWQGVFKGAGGYYTDRAKLAFKRVFDPIMDQDSTKATGWLVKSDRDDLSVLFVSGASLANGPLKPVQLQAQEIYPGDTFSFEYAGKGYRFFATGHKEKWNEAEYHVSGYALFLQGSQNDKTITQMLAFGPNMHHKMMYIVLVADLDGDQVPDMVIDTSDHYNMSRLTLFLSKSAQDGHILRDVGSHVSVGC